MNQLGPKPWSLANEPGGDTPLHIMDVWHFEYFRVVYAKELSLLLGSSLWESLVIRAAFSERCILNAVVALGALSRNTVPGARKGSALPTEFPMGYSLRKYNLAIQELNNRLAASPSRWDLAILGSLIFIAVESLRGNYGTAQMHLQGALAIIKAHDNPSDCVSQLGANLAHVLQALSRLLGQPMGLQEHFLYTPLRVPSLPPVFGTISEARDSLNSITGNINTLSWRRAATSADSPHSTPSPVSDQDLSMLLRLLDAWNSLFAKFVGDHTMDSKTESCVKILLIHHQIARISASVYSDPKESAYDAHTAEFANVINLAFSIMEAEQMPDPSKVYTGPNYTFGITLVQPLFFVACKCRDGKLRRKAIDVMGSIKGQSFCDIQLLIGVAKRIVTIEETPGKISGAAPFEVVESSRLRDVELDFGTAEMCTAKAWKRLNDGELSKVVVRLPLTAQ